ncbi:CoA transferase [Aquibium sp. A9E412]|uniref:CaiB/BaiF CoA transferase family protein n=1 Tax=Aquibium sp. A9E412 TaxID=2976767 RepID=UPI0025B0EC96|nr:CoA transferase [Aquibium sp. A9E412]MDN2565591.1 CoA transferase [Aquibium sp. A9E412]
MSADGSHGPLAGVKVIELAHVMAGPTCGRMLADMGAEVVKVERLPGGDDTRRDVVPGEPDSEDSFAFMMMNRNKRGIALDLKTEGGRETLHRMLAGADVMVENYRHDTLKKLGFDYETLRRRYPRLIYCAVSGFGRTGPYASRGGFDLIAQGMSGLMSITGEGEGRPPVKVGPPITDIAAGILAAMGVCAALHERGRTGRGQLVETSLFEAGIVFTYWHAAICFATGDNPGALGSAHPLSAPYQAYETADGWINIGGASQANWQRLVAVLGDARLRDDPRFASNVGRMANKAALDEILVPLLRGRPSAAWLAALEEAGVPAGPILSVAEMLRDPQTLARDMVRRVDHPLHGAVDTIGFPVKFSETPAAIERAAPLYGEHTREVLAACGYTAKQIEAMIAAGHAAASEPDAAQARGKAAGGR